jgi:glucose/arabinose dehydrogenase
MPRSNALLMGLPVLLALTACGETAKIAVDDGYGPSPKLPEPHKTLIPTINIAKAVGWAEGQQPTPADGLQVQPFAHGLDHPRTLLVLPNGDVLVAETNAPRKEQSGVKAWISNKVMSRAGAKTPSANRISLLRDSDGDGIAETKAPYVEGLNSPFGMALIGDRLYVANTDAIVSFPYVEGATRIDAKATKVADLPAGPINHHWTKDLIASRDGQKLYVTVGSNSNVGENGMGNEVYRAAILEVEPTTGHTRLFASGLRNPNGLAWEPRSGALWTVVNERDEIGSDLVPDYMTSVRDGGFYGWPYSYFGQHVDKRIQPARPELVAKAIVPDYALGAHTASLGLAFYEGELLAENYAGGAFVGQHGSWNRKPRSGYKVIFVPFDEQGRPAGPPEDILTGFVDDEEGVAYGRPVTVKVDKKGAVLVADDVGNTVWRITPRSPVN